MHVAFVFPNCWPYVRRGAERLLIEYARFLVSAGHTVDVVTSKPGPRRVVRDGPLTIYYERQLAHPTVSARWGLSRFYSFTLSVLPYLLRRPYHVAHVWYYPYALAVRLGRRVRGTPYLYHSMVDPVMLNTPLDRWAFHHTAALANRVAALTPRTAADLAHLLGTGVCVLPACVDLDTFAPVPHRDLRAPRVLFTSDLLDDRKGATLLLRAWDEIHRGCPEAVLTFAGPAGQSGFRGLDPLPLLHDVVHSESARRRVQFLGEGRVEHLPRRYAEAAVTVLPSVQEAFGLVVIESLACGTPVVANRIGGPGEILTDPAVGTMVTIPDVQTMRSSECAADLARAVLTTIDLARRPETAPRCREHAAEWSRARVGRLVERTYEEMIAASASGDRRLGS